MKKLLSLLLLLILINPIFCQVTNDSIFINKAEKQRRVNSVIGFIPSKADGVNGWAIGWIFLDALKHENDSVLINGLYTNISPLKLIMGAMLTPYIIFSPFKANEVKENLDWFDSIHKEPESRINGVSLSVLEFSDSYSVNGLQVSCILHEMNKLHGVSLSLIGSTYSEFKGVMISGILNNTRKGVGLQIGFINRAQKMNGIQIGIWNKMGERRFPIMKMNLKRKNTNAL